MNFKALKMCPEKFVGGNKKFLDNNIHAAKKVPLCVYFVI